MVEIVEDLTACTKKLIRLSYLHFKLKKGEFAVRANTEPDGGAAIGNEDLSRLSRLMNVLWMC